MDRARGYDGFLEPREGRQFIAWRRKPLSLPSSTRVRMYSSNAFPPCFSGLHLVVSCQHSPWTGEGWTSFSRRSVGWTPSFWTPRHGPRPSSPPPTSATNGRTKRLVILATQVAADPSGSFPQQTESWNDLRAAYNLFDREEVTFEAIASPHWELTKNTVEGRLLIVGDTTEIDYGLCPQIEGLAPIGSGYNQGFHLHSGLMVSAEGDRVHGLAGQLIYHRKPIAKGETRTERLRRDDRESQIWCKLVDQIGSPPPGISWVHVVDRGADDFEFFYHCQQTRTEWVARAKNLNRVIIAPRGEELSLKSYLQTLPVAGSFTIDLRARPKQPARVAKLVVAFGALTMPTPKLKSLFLKQVEPAPIPMGVVWVREVDAPEGVEPIEWVLYTSLPVENLEAALVVVNYYEKRWQIEEWHKVMKTGFRVEHRLLETSAARGHDGIDVGGSGSVVPVEGGGADGA